MPSESEELQELLKDDNAWMQPAKSRPVPAVAQEHRASTFEHCQWEVLPNGKFMATGPTKPKLEPGAYTVGITSEGRIVFSEKSILTDNLIDLGESNSLRVIQGIRKFWTKKERYHRRGVLFKRGVLMWGAAGTGKTATLSLLVEDLIRTGGIVLLVQNPVAATCALPVLRRIEPERPLILVLEDLEEIIRNNGEHELLSLLDGEHQTDNVVSLACPAPETRILRTDLTWCRADELREGDEIIAFDENGPQRKYRTAKVNACPRLNKPRYEVVTDKGTIVVSSEHPFLVNMKKSCWHRWIRAENLRVGHKIAFATKPWETDNTREGGYLAGQYDGEGSLSFSLNQHGSLSFRMLWDQARGPISDRVNALLLERGFRTKRHPKKLCGPNGSIGKRGPYKPRTSLHVLGGKWEQLRLLGSIRSYRLLAHPKLRKAWEGCRLAPDYAEVVSISPIGEGPVIGLDTTTHTFIGEGMLQHNTTNHPEQLGARIVNRPSRFDEVVKIGFPSEQMREQYLVHLLTDDVTKYPLAQWVKHTNGMSIAHLKELVIAVTCLDQPYESVIERLKAMKTAPKSQMYSDKVGFGAPNSVPTSATSCGTGATGK